MRLLIKNILKIIWPLFLINIFLFGCSENSDFGSNTDTKVRSPVKSIPTTTPVAEIPQTIKQDEEPTIEPIKEIVKVCPENMFQELKFNVGAFEQGNAGFDKWIYYSESFIIDPIQIEGDLLPITEFALDDFAFIIGANQTLEQSFPSSQTIQFEIPNEAIALSDLSANGQTGCIAPSPIHVFWTKVFVIGSKNVVAPFNSPTELVINSLIPQGMPVKRYNEIKLSDLKTSGYIDEDGFIRIKFAFIPSGYGATNIVIKVKDCH